VARNLIAAIQEFDENDRTVQLVGAVMRIVPSSPDYHHAGRLKMLAQQLHVAPSPENMNRIRSLAQEDRVGDALWMASALDTTDKAYGVYSGVKQAVNLFFGGKRRNVDFDAAQRSDAALKALGIAYMVHKAIPGTVTEKAKAFAEYESGQMLIAYFAGMEIALPFADNLITEGPGFLDQLLTSPLGKQIQRLSALPGVGSLDGVQETLTAISGSLKNGINRAQDKAPKLADAARRLVPAVSRVTDVATGVAAQGVDLMPVYRLLGARFIGEATIRRAGVS
jgi:X-X-X-Leu-X-X-Gly heptad repeat protein